MPIGVSGLVGQQDSRPNQDEKDVCDEEFHSYLRSIGGLLLGKSMNCARLLAEVPHEIARRRSARCFPGNMLEHLSDYPRGIGWLWNHVHHADSLCHPSEPAFCTNKRWSIARSQIPVKLLEPSP